jgi:hypothetical protein
MFRVRDGKAEVEHQAHRFIADVRFPAVARQQLEIGIGKAGDDAGMPVGDRLRFVAAGEDAADEQARLRLAVFVQEIEERVWPFRSAIWCG